MSKSDLHSSPENPDAGALDGTDSPAPVAADTWQKVLGIDWTALSHNACDQSGECCRGAAQLRPWANILARAASEEPTARVFLSQFIPYKDLTEAGQHAPDALAASRATLLDRDESASEADLVLYRCRYLRGRNECQIYEDRPTLCRDFPESPFGAIPSCCGYAGVARACRDELSERRAGLQAELEYYQALLRERTETSGLDAGNAGEE